MKKCIIIMLLLNLIIQGASGQDGQRIEGPVIFGYGETFSIENADFEMDKYQQYRVLFDISEKNADPEKVNRSLNTIARFINMHALKGISAEDMDIVAVVHGTASSDIMDDDFYDEKYNVDNPNADLIKQLQQAGVNFYLCGQTMHSRNLDRKQLLDEIKVALSAMTVINHFATLGYTQL